ncbi:hypothetical protein B0H17DRAFT_1130126 [Mycena rosella]|uniref:DUF6589 domain-containing protein n=1 Tax=Mycena rosella TaxID=1033263 RepID=A0AAD7DU57_MYCRO|nr:hypothetical protein B0H17DRAFT_1148657 [Mycena rosella]KAJ7697847.1 hypothetical protein B0H17DRAFT_1130126 [Mycena rosella]
MLLMHDLMKVREMRHAIKHGHPEPMERMLKYWTPMSYAGGSYNYANKSMELLHNLNHDWPSDISLILRGGLVYWKRITPTIGHIQELTEQIFEDLGVSDEDQHHAKVKQHKEVTLLLDHLCKSKIFDFTHDKLTNHTMVDLYRTGLHRLAGSDGGHAKHLRRHVLRSRTRHFNEMPPENVVASQGQLDVLISEEHLEYQADIQELEGLDHELALDNERPKFTLLEQLQDLDRWGIDITDDSIALYD